MQEQFSCAGQPRRNLVGALPEDLVRLQLLLLFVLTSHELVLPVIVESQRAIVIESAQTPTWKGRTAVWNGGAEGFGLVGVELERYASRWSRVP